LIYDEIHHSTETQYQLVKDSLFQFDTTLDANLFMNYARNKVLQLINAVLLIVVLQSPIKESLITALDDVELNTNIQIKTFLSEIREIFQTMIRTVNILSDVD
jgi:hypothetical protein